MWRNDSIDQVSCQCTTVRAPWLMTKKRVLVTRVKSQLSLDDADSRADQAKGLPPALMRR